MQFFSDLRSYCFADALNSFECAGDTQSLERSNAIAEFTVAAQLGECLAQTFALRVRGQREDISRGGKSRVRKRGSSHAGALWIWNHVRSPACVAYPTRSVCVRICSVPVWCTAAA